MPTEVDVPMPKLGDTVTEGTVIEWLVAVGDTVELDQPIAEITTDKVTTEYPSPWSGTIVALLVNVDVTVLIGTPIIRISTEDAVDVPLVAPPEPASTTATSTAPVTAPRPTGAARAAALAANIDITAVAGTGRHGRVRQADLAAFVAPTAVPTGSNPIRRAMAHAMEESWSQAAHAVVHGRVDVDDLARARAARRDLIRHRHGIDLTALPFWVHALARVLGAPGDIGVAVARRDGTLLVPIVRGAGDDLETCAVALDAAVTQARAGKVPPHAAGGGQATITNIGVFGGRFSQPILNPGQPFILGLGAVERRLVPGDGGLRLGAVQSVSLVYDRCRCDEVAASALLASLRAELANVVAA